MRPGALDGENVLDSGQFFARQKPAESLYHGFGPLRKVEQGFLPDGFPFAPGLAQEDGGGGVSVGHGLDVQGSFPFGARGCAKHGCIMRDCLRLVKNYICIYMGTFATKQNGADA